MKNIKGSVQNGFTSICVAVALAVGAGLFLYYYNQLTIKEQAKLKKIESNNILIDRILTLKSERFLNIIHDNSGWDELIDAIYQRDSSWVIDNVYYMVDSYAASGLIIYDSTGNQVFDCYGKDFVNYNFCPVGNVSSLFSDTCYTSFYLKQNDKVFEVFGATVVSSIDITTRKESPKGYMLFSRNISDSLLNDYAKVLNGMKPSLVTCKDSLQKYEALYSRNYCFSKVDLPAYNGNPEAYLYFLAEDESKDMLKQFLPVFIVIGLSCILVLCLLIYYVQRRVITPLKKLNLSLHTGCIDPILYLRDNTDEFGLVESTVEEFFEQKESMEQLNVELETQREEILQRNEILQTQQEVINAGLTAQRNLNKELESNNMILADQKVSLQCQAEILEENKSELENMLKNLQDSYDETARQNCEIQRQKEDLESQRAELEVLYKAVSESNEIISSAHEQLKSGVNYAFRLQSSLLSAVSPQNVLHNEFFIIYEPKETVGGDFYFFRLVGNKIIAALGDCTGHGIPGAILASMGISFLKEITDHIIDPAEILNLLREKFISSFSGDGDIRNDGMDVALLVYNIDTFEAEYAGAQRPLIYIHNGELIEIKGDRMPVGRGLRITPFTNNSIRFEKGDCVYMYSDGCTDQAGGERGHKLLSVNFKQTLRYYSVMPMDEQKEAIISYIDSWRGNRNRTDDISLLAFKL